MSQLIGRATAFRAVLTDPITGYPLGVGRKSYRVPAHIRELIMLRDQQCRHPGCERPAAAAEMDHVDPWANGGHTGYAEMVAKCPEHHRGKTAGWYRDQFEPEAGDGSLTFEDPRSGQRRTSTPPFPMDPKAWEAYRVENTVEPPF
ncbi:HNH endonuclease signature motif containing protein [Micrococcoides hystricis]|uniref:HNH endonuclease signature motif containing protein n=1 Tax=Micrococcoides hystricis TaxID=1572761 RepID=A0ABV6P810_9MICC